MGVGVGAKWGSQAKDYAVIILLIGAIFHVYGMYVTQLKNPRRTTDKLAKALWISAWLCLIALVAVFVYLLFQQD